MRARTWWQGKAALLLACIVFASVQAQQLQDEGWWDIDEDQPAPVPAVPTAERRQLQSVSGSYGGYNELGGYYGQNELGGYYGQNELGGYGYYGPSTSTTFGTRRQLQEVAGGYGGYGNNELGGYYGNDELGGYYGGNELGGYYGSPARAALLVTSQPVSTLQDAATAATVGQCYCRYESDYNTWALGEDLCKNALYQKCKAGSRLPCSWLDEYYGMSSFGAQRTGYSMPHESQISAFLFEDCTPKPPCGCTNMAFNGLDDAARSYKCCRDMRVHCRHSASGLSCDAVSAYCNADQPSLQLATWVDSALANAQCSAYNGLPYAFVPLEQMTAAAAAAAKKAADAEQPAAQPAAEVSSGGLGAGAIGGIVAGGIAAVALAAVAAAAVVRRQRAATQFQPLLDAHAVAEQGMGGQALVGSLRRPVQAVYETPAHN